LNPKASIQLLNSFSNDHYQISTLRLDEIHPIVSGNKWYKLRFYIQAALDQSFNTIASFGGPYSNHLVALAFTAKQNKLKSIGYVRSNKNEPITPTLQEAVAYGMQLEFIGRTKFQAIKNELIEKNKHKGDIYYVDEGGYGLLGAQGASSIYSANDLSSFNTIICAVGTGTMFAGLINGAAAHQQLIGIPILKNENTIKNEINQLILNKQTTWSLLHQFDEGGYAKINPALLQFMNELWTLEKIPTDIVYTGKLFLAVKKLIQENYFRPNSKIAIIHSGGLQGNRSLPAHSLLY
jgi:1-aminocyclopropane-1-carboxylate deaminase